MALPVCFIHQGNQKWLEIAISRAIKSGNEVYLLGDETNKHFTPNWYSLKACETELSEEFKKRYEHMSSMPERFELFCMLRYFYLYAFMENNGINEVIMVDSDCLVYHTYVEGEYSGYDCAFCYEEDWVSPTSCFWTKRAIRSFLDYMLELYGENKKILLDFWDKYDKTRNGGVNDMTLLNLWVRSDNAMKILNLYDDKEVICEYIPEVTSENREIYKYNKYTQLLKIVFISNMPHFVRQNGELQRVNNLHMHGGKKIYMSPLSKCKSDGISFYILAIARKVKWWIVKRIYRQK